jgi:hypothetical protein
MPSTEGSWPSRSRRIARPGFNRWLVPPAALCVHLCIGQAYAFSVFSKPMSVLLGGAEPAPGDWSIPRSVGSSRSRSCSSASPPRLAAPGWRRSAAQDHGDGGRVLGNYIRQYQIDAGVAKADASTVTMSIMAALLGLVLNLLMRPVSERHHMAADPQPAPGAFRA